MSRPRRAPVILRRQLNRHDGAALRRALDRDRAAVRLDDALRRRQAQTRAARLRREERLEDPSANVGGKAPAPVPNPDAAGGPPPAGPPTKPARTPHPR